MRILFLILFTSSFLSCTSQNERAVVSNSHHNIEDSLLVPPETVDPSLIDTVDLGLNFIPEGSYNSVKHKINERRINANSGEDLENYLLDQIIPHWYGTPWDFNGYTAIPNEGVIACGYFVSTTLVHAGFKLNRYHLAQQAGLNEAKTLAITEDNYRTIYGIDSLEHILKRDYTDGLYFVGLDNHVGYLYINHKVPYFIHSNYLENKVMLEKALYSDAFQSTIYVIAEITTNDELLEKWRKEEVVEVVRE